MASEEMMEVDDQSPSISSTSDEMIRRPDFVNKPKLLKNHSCGMCSDVLLQPHQTPCGTKVCKSCIEAKFGGQPKIPCPLSHDDLDEEELKEEVCQQEGLIRELVVPDPGSLRVLLKEKCFCPNKDYGCRDTPQWKKLEEHQQQCQYVPTICINGDAGCPKLLAKCDMDRHISHECDFGITYCLFCKTPHKRRDLEEHMGECAMAGTQCYQCNEEFEKHKMLVVHQKTHAPCMTQAGRCFYFRFCGFENRNLSKLKKHMEKKTNLHLKSLNLMFYEMEQVSVRDRGMPDPDSSSFRRPQTEMNIASGCPQFALHSEVESSTSLARVVPGGI